VRYVRPIQPDPGPTALEPWSLVLALMALAFGCSAGLESFHESGAIAEGIYEAVMFFVWGVPTGAIIAVFRERRAYRKLQKSAAYKIVNPKSFRTWRASSSRRVRQRRRIRLPRRRNGERL
jgi:hypothetical protein